MTRRTAAPAALVSGAYAEELRATVVADPSVPVAVGVQGAGGHGKSALLADLARIYQAAGVPVLNGTGPIEPDAAVLVDDAHRLSPSALTGLRELATHPRARLVVAYRPWPRPPELGELVSALGRGGPPVVLAGLGPDDLATRIAAPREWLEWLCAQTGGVPRFVDRVLAGPDDVGWPKLPRAALEQFHHDFDQLDEHGRACLVAMAIGAAPHPELLASVLGIDPRAAIDALSAARASGLLGAEDVPLPIATQAVVLLTPSDYRLRMTRSLVDIQLDRGAPVLPLVKPLMNSSMVAESGMGTAFAAAGDEALSEAPELATHLFDAALTAGAASSGLAARRACAAAAGGDLDVALRLADQVIVDDSAPQRALGIRVAASVLAHRGLLSRSAELCAWSVREVRWPGDLAFAVTGLIGVGRLDEAEDLLRAPGESGPPTSLSGAATQLADGVRESVAGSAGAAMSTLVRAASLAEPLSSTVMIPDTPAAIAAIVASHCGEFDVAESMLDKAIESGTGGPLLRSRHRLLAAWLPLVRGDTVTARSRLEAAEVGPAARDRLLWTAIETGIANRDNDMTALAAVRGQIRTAVAEHPIDLFALLPLGELVFAAARLRDQEWLTPYLREARTLLSRLGNPPLWTSLLTWKCLQAAIVVEDLDTAHSYANELDGMSGHNPMSAAMAEAARVWLRILRDRVDHDEADRAARGLHAAGLAWDGARLAGQAAIRTTERPAMLALLECARALQGKGPRPRAVDGANAEGLLSEREKEVAELVLSGLTYKQVGKRLFISAKTVEHHVGRIKQRLGCTNREELLNRLRELINPL